MHGLNTASNGGYMHVVCTMELSGILIIYIWIRTSNFNFAGIPYSLVRIVPLYNPGTRGTRCVSCVPGFSSVCK